MKFTIWFVLLFSLVSYHEAYCPLIKLKHDNIEKQLSVYDCLKRCRFIIMRPVQKAKCELCCRTKQWDLHLCWPESPKLGNERTKWSINKYLPKKRPPWHFKDPYSENRKVIKV